MGHRAFVVTIDTAEAEWCADRLFALGAAAVEERPVDERVVELWTHVGDDDADIEGAAAQLGGGVAWRVVDIDPAVAEAWREHARPIVVADDLLVVPAWLPPPDAAASTRLVAIDPGAAFGMGDHPTTLLTARALHRRAAAGELGRVLDVGCGSGVLAVIAALHGAEVTAIDIAAAAVSATVANAARNGVAARIAASTTALADIDGEFDLVLANILAPTITELADDLIRVTGGGELVISGVLASDEARMAAVLAPLRVVEAVELDGWAAIRLAGNRSPRT